MVLPMIMGGGDMYGDAGGDLDQLWSDGEKKRGSSVRSDGKEEVINMEISL